MKLLLLVFLLHLYGYDLVSQNNSNSVSISANYNIAEDTKEFNRIGVGFEYNFFIPLDLLGFKLFTGTSILFELDTKDCIYFPPFIGDIPTYKYDVSRCDFFRDELHFNSFFNLGLGYAFHVSNFPVIVFISNSTSVYKYEKTRLHVTDNSPFVPNGYDSYILKFSDIIIPAIGFRTDFRKFGNIFVEAKFTRFNYYLNRLSLAFGIQF